MSQQTVLVAVGTSDVNGNLTITFPTVGVNAAVIGNVSIPTAPSSANISLLIDGTQVATLLGANSYGPLQLTPSNMMQLVGQGFQPSTQYQGIVMGTIGVLGGATPIPSPTTVAVQAGGFAQEILTASPIAAAGGTVTVNLPAGTETLWIEVGALAGGIDPTGLAVTVQGVQSGFYYSGAGGSFLPYLPQNASNLYTFVIPVSSAMDSQIQVTAQNASSVAMICNVFADTQARQPSDFFWPYRLLSATSTPNNQTLTLLTGPARLLTATLNSTGFATITLNNTSNQILVVNPSGAASCTFPPNTLLGIGQKLQCTTTAGPGSTTGAIVYAYP